MRAYYPFLSEEFNDVILETYAHYAYLLGYDNSLGETTYSGVYDITEDILNEVSLRYVTLRNSYAPDGASMPQYIDSISAKLTLRRH